VGAKLVGRRGKRVNELDYDGGQDWEERGHGQDSGEKRDIRWERWSGDKGKCQYHVYVGCADGR